MACASWQYRENDNSGAVLSEATLIDVLNKATKNKALHRHSLSQPRPLANPVVALY